MRGVGLMREICCQMIRPEKNLRHVAQIPVMIPVDPAYQVTIHAHSIGNGAGAVVVSIILIFSLIFFLFADRETHLLYFSFILIAMALFLWGFTLYVSARTVSEVEFWTRVTYTGVSLAPLAFHLYVEKLIGKRIKTLSTFITALWLACAVCIWVDHGALITDQLKTNSDHPSMVKGPLFVPYFATIFVSLLTSYGLFIRHFVFNVNFRRLAWPLMIGFTIWIGNGFYDGLNAAGVVGFGTATWLGPVVMALMIALFLGRLTIDVRRKLVQLNDEKERLYSKMIRDGLTGLYSRSYLENVLSQILERRRRSVDVDYGLLFIDLDNFKAVNDALGHAAGDRVLCGLAEILQASCRGSDVPARFGGDEFLLLLCGCTVEGAASKGQSIIQAFRQLIAESNPGAGPAGLGLSIGVSHSQSWRGTLGNIVDQADQAMYRAKLDGKNLVRIHVDADQNPAQSP